MDRITWKLVSVGFDGARWPLQVADEGKRWELQEAEREPRTSSMAPGAFCLRKRDARTGQVLVEGPPALLAGAWDETPAVVWVPRQGPSQGRARRRGNPLAGGGVWVAPHFGYLHRFDADTAEAVCTVAVAGHVGPLRADHEALYANVEFEIIRIDSKTGAVMRWRGEGEDLALLDGFLATGRDDRFEIIDGRTLETLHSVEFPYEPALWLIAAAEGAFWINTSPPDHPELTEIRRVTPRGEAELVFRR